MPTELRTARRGPNGEKRPLPPPEEEVSAAGTAYPYALTCMNTPEFQNDLVRRVVRTVERTAERTVVSTVVPTVVPVQDRSAVK